MSQLPETMTEHDAHARVDALRHAQSANEQASLADALLHWSYTLSRDGRTHEAVEAAEEGIKTLSPLFLADPERYVDDMNALIAEYIGVSQHSRHKADMSLIKPLAGMLGRFGHFYEEQ